MTKRTFYNVVLLALIIPVNEMHHLFKDDIKMVNSWWFLDYPLNIQWYVKFLCLNISDVLKGFLIYRVSRLNQVFRIAAATYLIYTLFDLIMFFWNFNKGDYMVPYSFIAVIIISLAYYRQNKRDKEMLSGSYVPSRDKSKKLV